MQIESYIFDEVRSAVPGMTLDDVFQNKEIIANAVKEGLEETMTQYGYGIVRALVNDIDPDPKVKAAMNEINAAQRLRKAAEERGEADRILKVKQAQGDAESKRLQGVGIADQRKAIVDGLRESVEEFRKGVPGSTSNDVMQLVLMTQYFDTLKEIGGAARSSVILLPHSPSTLNDLSSQIRDSLIAGNSVVAENERLTLSGIQESTHAEAHSARLARESAAIERAELDRHVRDRAASDKAQGRAGAPPPPPVHPVD
jgi:regulator of protease activity HflC (stomatin/prohibitin superfamily)